jgi:hypothetical protein
MFLAPELVTCLVFLLAISSLVRPSLTSSRQFVLSVWFGRFGYVDCLKRVGCDKAFADRSLPKETQVP